MTKRTRFFIILIVVICGIYFLMPTIQWYFLFSPEDRNEASLVADKLKLDIEKKVEKSLNSIKEEKIQGFEKEYDHLNDLFIKELKTINKAVRSGIISNLDQNTKIPDIEIKIKKIYTYDEMKKILTDVNDKEKYVNAFFNDSLEDYYIKEQDKKKKVKDNIIKLGLDLQGGAYAVVTINFDDPEVKKKIEKVVEDEKKTGKETDEKDVNKIIEKYKEAMIDSAMIKIENRINKYGLSETSIQKLGGLDKIVINLPGVKEATELRQLIETVGVLEFKLVSEDATQRVNEVIRELRSEGKYAFDNRGKLLPEMQDKINKELPGVDILLTSEKNKWGEEEDIQYVYAVEKKSLLGETIKITNAGVQQDYTGGYYVAFQLDNEATKDWAQITGDNIGRKIAIILDDVVLYAPVVKERIPMGQSSIQLGNTPLTELNNLALILRSGSLSVPLEISEEHTVGASLGRDTIEKGLWASLIGAIFVIGFMFLYYSIGGIIADLTLAFNIMLLMSGLALFQATLTLPGIAGIVLTVGMAVDANVIIFERIKEELNSGKTFSTAFQLGHEKAFWTIMDSNLTTFAAGIGLSIFGTGPIKGFAVTLCLGIVTTLFSTLFMSKLILESLNSFINFKSMRVLSLIRGK
ncbi:MAG: protein translocase subunit SecD [Spirochaetes bacterium]|nr:protein translocase subunit SecD [Spirochaetota bacterium]